jgi:hypothetical protein
MRVARVLRTLALLDLESHPPAAAIDRVRVGVEVTEGRVLQFGLFARALPAERLATLMARLGALMGGDRVGAPALVDTHRPGAFAMAKFEPSAEMAQGSRFKGLKAIPAPHSRIPTHIVRRFRSPLPARVTLEQGRPVRVGTDRRGFTGGAVERCDGPWRSSGDWWLSPSFAPQHGAAAPQVHAPRAPWYCDEWDVTLSDGASYRISRVSGDTAKDTWFVDGMLD